MAPTPPSSPKPSVDMKHQHALLLIRGQTPGEILQDRIMSEGTVLDGGKLKLNTFINHQIDCHLMSICGQHLAYQFRGKGITRVMARGKAGAVLGQCIGVHMRLPLVVATEVEPMVAAPHKLISMAAAHPDRHTGGTIHVSSEVLTPQDRVLIVDDFLASGVTASQLAQLVKAAGATVAGFGFMVEKSYEGGRDKLASEKVKVDALVVVTSVEGGKITCAPDPDAAFTLGASSS